MSASTFTTTRPATLLAALGTILLVAGCAGTSPGPDATPGESDRVTGPVSRPSSPTVEEPDPGDRSGDPAVEPDPGGAEGAEVDAGEAAGSEVEPDAGAEREEAGDPAPDPAEWRRMLAEAAEIEEAASAGSSFPGTLVPELVLTSHEDEPVGLTEPEGWTIIYFFPETDLPGCVCDAIEPTKVIQELDHLAGVTVLGISRSTPALLLNLRKKYELERIVFLSDPRFEAVREFRAFGEGGIARQTFLVDPDGLIVHHWPEVVPAGHASRVMTRIEGSREP